MVFYFLIHLSLNGLLRVRSLQMGLKRIWVFQDEPVLVVWDENPIEHLWWWFCPGSLEVGTSFLSVSDHISGPTFPTRVGGANLSEVFEAGMWSAEGSLLSINR